MLPKGGARKRISRRLGGSSWKRSRIDRQLLANYSSVANTLAIWRETDLPALFSSESHAILAACIPVNFSPYASWRGACNCPNHGSMRRPIEGAFPSCKPAGGDCTTCRQLSKRC